MSLAFGTPNVCNKIFSSFLILMILSQSSASLFPSDITQTIQNVVPWCLVTITILASISWFVIEDDQSEVLSSLTSFHTYFITFILYEKFLRCVCFFEGSLELIREKKKERNLKYHNKKERAFSHFYFFYFYLEFKFQKSFWVVVTKATDVVAC